MMLRIPVCTGLRGVCTSPRQQLCAKVIDDDAKKDAQLQVERASACVRACMRACVRACVRVCLRVCLRTFVRV